MTQVREPSFDHPTSPEVGDRERRKAAPPAMPFVSLFRHTVTRQAGRHPAAPENRPMYRILSLLPLLALATAPRLLQAQGSITGTVKDSAAGTPLAGVTITVDGTTLTAHSDAAGRYTVVTVPAGTQRLRARLAGRPRRTWEPSFTPWPLRAGSADVTFRPWRSA